MKAQHDLLSWSAPSATAISEADIRHERAGDDDITENVELELVTETAERLIPALQGAAAGWRSKIPG